MTLDGLDLPGRAALLGLGCAAYVDLAQSDRRIALSVKDGGSLARTKRWIAAGQPEPDFDRLEFRGDEGVRAVVIDVLRRVPKSVGWDATEHVVFVEVGRNALGWQGAMPAAREQMIALCGKYDDAQLIDVVAHELGHNYSRPTGSLSSVSLSPSEHTARLVAFGVAADELSRAEAAREKLADDFAEVWGFRRHHRGAQR